MEGVHGNLALSYTPLTDKRNYGPDQLFDQHTKSTFHCAHPEKELDIVGRLKTALGNLNSAGLERSHILQHHHHVHRLERPTNKTAPISTSSHLPQYLHAHTIIVHTHLVLLLVEVHPRPQILTATVLSLTAWKPSAQRQQAQNPLLMDSM